MNVKLSSKNQIVIPKDARRVLGTKSGDTLLVVPKGSVVVLMKEPHSYVEKLRGMVSKIGRHLQKERRSWGKR